MLDKPLRGRARGLVAGQPKPAMKPSAGTGPIRGTPVLPSRTRRAGALQQLGAAAVDDALLSRKALQVLDALRTHGAELSLPTCRTTTHLLGMEVEQALAELVAHGLVSCDSFRRPARAGDAAGQAPATATPSTGHDPIDDAGVGH